MPLIRNIVLVAVSRGADLAAMCRTIGITPVMLERSDAFVDLDQSIRIWEAAMSATGDPFLGLHSV